MWEGIIKFAKDTLFPVYCLGCQEEGEWLCSKCFNQIDPPGVFCCPVCHISNITGYCCNSCISKSYLKQHLAIFNYEEDKLPDKLIEGFKYYYWEELEKYFQIFVNDFVDKNSNKFLSFDLIIPVPLHLRRLAERGFNQAEVIANLLSLKTKIPWQKDLQRIICTKQQAKLKKADRELNVKGAFSLSDDNKNLPKNILLVDDVFTTGSTLEECAKVLKSNGAKTVSGFTLARA